MQLKVKLKWEFDEEHKIYSCFILLLNNRSKIYICKYNDYWTIYDIHETWYSLYDDNNKYATESDAMQVVEKFVAKKLSIFISEVSYES